MMQNTELKTRSASIDAMQSGEYQFPYHYIPNARKFPSFARHWGYSSSYLAALDIARDWLLKIRSAEYHKHMDYGCGDGGFVNNLLEYDELKDIHFEGVDFDESAIRWAKMFSRNPGSFRAVDISTLPNNHYGSGTLIEVFEHIPPAECEGFVAGIARSLKPNSQMFVTVPSTEKPLNPKHYRHFDFPTLEAYFVDEFDIVEIFGFEKKPKWMKLLNKCLRNSRFYFESSMLNRAEIKQLSEKHRELKGCGRIGLILRKK